jgi:hypothetical protein
MTPNNIDCIPGQLKVKQVKSRPIVVNFHNKTVTSDAGVSLIAELDRKRKITSRLAECFKDYRDVKRIEHSVENLIAQRIYGLIMGYEDLNDHDELRHDPMFVLALGKIIDSGKELPILAGKSTLNRLEHCPENVYSKANSRYHRIEHDGEAIEKLLVEIFLESHSKPPRQIILDLDVTDDLVHGNQEEAFFNPYYGGYCYAPLYIFCGQHLLAAKLRASNVDPASGALSELQRVILKIRSCWMNVKILVRGDSAYAREDIMSWCESQTGVDYVFGLAQNSRLLQLSQSTQYRASQEYSQKLQTAVEFFETLFTPSSDLKKQAAAVVNSSIWYSSLDYKTLDSWSRNRRVVAKVEYSSERINTRFVVTSLSTKKVPPGKVYTQIYCPRGNIENCFKEQKLELKSDRTSTHTFAGNQLRLWFSAIAYILMNALRKQYLAKTKLKNATVGTIRTKLLKLEAIITVSSRKVLISISSTCPYKEIFVLVYNYLSCSSCPG